MSESSREETHGLLERIGYLFYIVNPKKSSFANIEEVPNYVVKVVPLFAILIVLENFISKLKKKRTARVNDGIGSISQGLVEQLIHLTTKGFQCMAYIYVYDNWRFISLPWDSVWTWVLAFLAVDLGYYWMHRASHEINILWAAHQVHHSSEDYNLTTALRQSALQDYGTWFFYLPMAFCMPPSMYLVHQQFNLLYQFWIHTELIKSLGPLEYILNTPSHHRVHHGRNRYCIDKNYAGTLIIWDRMFGTFEAEDKEVVYGLTHPINTFSAPYVQLCHYLHIFKTFWNAESLRHKLSVIFKGPGWEPGKPWHGCLEDIPDVQAPAEVYDPKIALWCTVYAFGHFLLVALGYIEITERFSSFPWSISLGVISYLILSVTAIAALLDGRFYAPWIELVRCILFIIIDHYFIPLTRFTKLSSTIGLICLSALRIIFVSSALLWLRHCIKTTSIHSYTKPKEKCN